MNAPRKPQEWLQRQRATIGGSNAAAAVGLNPFKSPLRLYHEMVLGEVEDLEGNPDVLRGILLEPVARQRLGDLLNMEVIEHDQNEFVRNIRYHWAHALPDGWIQFNGERIPIEIKVPDPWNFANLHAKVPDYIECQAIHNAAVLASPALFLCCLNPSTMGLYTRLYEPTEKDISALMEAEERYWNEHIVARVPPAVQQTREDFKLAWPVHVPGTSIVATAEIEEAWGDLIICRQDASAMRKRIDELSLKLQSYMEDKEMLLASEDNQFKDRPILATWRSHPEKRLDSKKLKGELPEVWNDFAQEKDIRTFLVKSPK